MGWQHTYTHSTSCTHFFVERRNIMFLQYCTCKQSVMFTSRGSSHSLIAWTGRFLREKLISDHGHFSSYEGHKERRTGKIRGAFSRMHRALDGWMLARAPASPVQGLHHHGPRYFDFPYFCTKCVALRNLDLLIKTGWSVIFPVFCWERWSWVGDNIPSRSRLLSNGVRRFDEPFWYWSVPLLVEPHNFLSRFGSLLVWVAGCHHDVTRWPSYLFVTTSGIGVW